MIPERAAGDDTTYVQDAIYSPTCHAEFGTQPFNASAYSSDAGG